MTYRKKLIEVALPLAAINAESAREKSIRHGHPSTLHLWWARRPLAACRAVLFSSLVDDPDSDPQYRKPDGSVDEEAAGIKRAELFNLIEELVMWENSNNADVIRSARAEIARCVASRLIETEKLQKDAVISDGATAFDLVRQGHCKPLPMGLDKKVGRVRFSFDVSRLPDVDAVNAFLAEHAPPVLDPFAGGGSIPLEAQRLGLRAYASDLNPLPVLINKALIELPPRFADQSPVNPESRTATVSESRKAKQNHDLIEKEWSGASGLAEDVRYYGRVMRDLVEKRIGHLYPDAEVTPEMTRGREDLLQYVGKRLPVIAWLWARIVRCPNPACHGSMPLVSSFKLSARKSNIAFVVPKPIQSEGRVAFEVRTGTDTPPPGVVTRRGVRCLLCDTTVPFEYIREQGSLGAIGQQLMAIVAKGSDGRLFLPATDEQEQKALQCEPPSFAETDLPEAGLGFRVQRYGITQHRQLFTSRQLSALCALSDLTSEISEVVLSDGISAGLVNDDSRLSEGGQGARAYADAVATYLAIAVSKSTDLLSSLCHWQPNPEHLKIAPTFARPTLSMTWDFAEGNPLGDSSGCFIRQPELIEKVLSNLHSGVVGQVLQKDAQEARQEPGGIIVSTDPPYYDNIGYADLSDFFYVWLRRMLQPIYPSLFSTVLVPKTSELISDPSRHGGQGAARKFFEVGLEKTFQWIVSATPQDIPFTVYYAFKQTEADSQKDGGDKATVSTGWEAMLEGLARAGVNITGTWPVRTERSGRLRDNASNALASSIVLVCRQRSSSATQATRKEFLAALRRELPEALRNLQRGNIAPVDLAQAAIGPGMAIFTRYARVLESDGSAMAVRTALGLINQALDEVLAEQEGEFDGDTRWALAWFEQFGIDDGPFGDAETLSKAKNTAINGLVEAGVIVAKSGKVRLIRRDELPSNWNPAADKRLTVWEVTQHLIHRLDEEGEIGAATLLSQLGSIGEIARDLAYRLYSTCERKKWAQEAMAYNTLVVAWPELSKLAQSHRNQQPRESQTEMF